MQLIWWCFWDSLRLLSFVIGACSAMMEVIVLFPPFKSIGSTTVSLSSKDKQKVLWQPFLPKSCGYVWLEKKKQIFEGSVGLGMFFGRIPLFNTCDGL